ncbi:MBL fold metallo-hydrolase [Desulfovibrio ferrophilus]|uniref:Beta-lactamase domain-containing protein n=1 Tax=Desulfovibrio ferrophilus TaxID=241368 RepID=A0A2Z6B395_9BACT|nr:MBL fold metallo-hydrolase [Desulfovibrio ferrophilus]BBD09961.1 beta-lactamase domain-containing protein [Desulfovibrio ferrophilus]
MNIRSYALGPLMTNGFLVSNGTQALFIDPGGDPAPVLEDLRKAGLTLKHIIITHLHCDHIYGAAALTKATGAPVLANPEDEFLMGTEVGGGGLMGLPMVDNFEYEPLNPGVLKLLDQPVEVLPTPGHTPGSVSLYFKDQGAVFVGDLLFKRSIGRTDFPGGSTPTLMDSVRERIFTLPPETVVYSGHGPETTVGDEHLHNPFFQE